MAACGESVGSLPAADASEPRGEGASEPAAGAAIAEVTDEAVRGDSDGELRGVTPCTYCTPPGARGRGDGCDRRCGEDERGDTLCRPWPWGALFWAMGGGSFGDGSGAACGDSRSLPLVVGARGGRPSEDIGEWVGEPLLPAGVSCGCGDGIRDNGGCCAAPSSSPPLS